MMLRHSFLFAAFGASLLSAPALAQGTYTSGSSYGGDTPPGYLDPYTQGAPAQGAAGGAMERNELPPPSGYSQAPTYDAQAAAPAQQTYQQQTYNQAAYPQGGAAPSYGQGQPAQAGYGQDAGYGQQAATSQPSSPYEEQQRAYGAAYNQSYEQMTGAPAQAAAPSGQQGGYQQGSQGGYVQPATYGGEASPPAGVYAPNSAVVPGTDQAPSGPRIENVDPAEPVPERFRRQEVDYVTTQPAGTIIVDTPNTYLYYVLGNNRAVRYGIGVGREGFTWSGVQKVSRKAEWPDWRPPAEMIQRQPYLPRFMAGGPGNPMGARAMYLGATIYRIHGTNEPQTIGKFVSSGCIRMLNNDAEDLFDRVKVGTKVVIKPGPKNPVPQTTASVDPVDAPVPGTTGSIPASR